MQDPLENPNLLKELSYIRERERRLSLILWSYLGIGVMLAISSLIYFFLLLFEVRLSSPQQAALLGVGLGVIMAAGSAMYLVARKQRHRDTEVELQSYLELGSLLDAWRRFEEVGRNYLAMRNQDFNPHSVKDIIAKLHADGRIDDVEVEQLRRALETRNAVAHGNRAGFDRHTVNQVIDVLAYVTARISAV